MASHSEGRPSRVASIIRMQRLNTRGSNRGSAKARLMPRTVKGHGGVPVGGHGISLLADSSSPCLRSVDLPEGVLVQGDHPETGGGFGQA